MQTVFFSDFVMLQNFKHQELSHRKHHITDGWLVGFRFNSALNTKQIISGLFDSEDTMRYLKNVADNINKKYINQQHMHVTMLC